jgi:hypothetical protein
VLLAFLATTIVAAFDTHVAAAVAVSEDVPVPGGTAAFAQSLGFELPPDRARFIAELARLLYNIPEGRSAAVEGLLLRIRQTGRADDGPAAAADADLVPVPLTSAIWSEAVFHRRVPPSGLVAAIFADRQAALLCHGLAGLDDATLQFFVEHPASVTHLHQRAAATFAVFAGSLHVVDSRVVPPGGDAAVPLWESAVGEKVTRPERFVRELFSRSEGRVAYLYDGIGQLDAPHKAFALGLWIRSTPVRADRFKALSIWTEGAYHEWRLKTMPFARPIYDVASLLTRVRVAADGTPLPPASRAFWAAAFEGAGLPDAGTKPGGAGDEPADAAWLAQTIASGDVNQRNARFDEFSFGQHAFAAASAADRADLLIALRAFGRYRMLMLTLDRLGISKPSVYAAAARHAGRLAALDRHRGFTALAQFQGTLALVARMMRARTIDPPKAEALVASLVALPVGDDGYGGKLLEWIGHELRPMSPAADDVESGVIAQLAGIRAGAAAPISVAWEGQQYHLDLAAAEDRRLHRIRRKQGGLPLDLALDLEATARKLGAESVTAADIAAGTAALKKAFAAFPPRSRSDPPIVASGLEIPRDPRDLIARMIDELGRLDKARDAKKAMHIVEPLALVAEAVAADALLSMAYAVDLGDPEGTVLLAGNVALRHDFGFGISDPETRARTAWNLPKQEVAPGVPWHVSGSALGLDVALASLALRRVDTGRVSDAPRLTSNERQTFAVSVALINPFALADADRDAIADAIARGAARVAALTPQSFDAVANESVLDGWRRRAAMWSMSHGIAPISSMFSLTELLYLGGGPPPQGLDAWGMAAYLSAGCLCTHLVPPGGWWNLTGRPQLGLLATTVADLHLHVAVTLRNLGLPAGIARHVLSAAVQDYIDEVRPSDNQDWLTLVRAAQQVPRDRIEDYVAAITADGPLVPDTPPGSPGR